jgi:hypothetical protein
MLRLLAIRMHNLVCPRNLDTTRRTAATRTRNRQDFGNFCYGNRIRDTVRMVFGGCKRLMRKHQNGFIMRGDVIIRPSKTRGGLLISLMRDLCTLTDWQTIVIPITPQATTATTTTAATASFAVSTFTVSSKFTGLTRGYTLYLLVSFAIEGNAINIGLRRIKRHWPWHIRAI